MGGDMFAISRDVIDHLCWIEPCRQTLNEFGAFEIIYI